MSRKTEDIETIEILSEHAPVMDNHLKDLKIFRNPSLSYSILETKDGKKRFQDFSNEFQKLLKSN